MKSQQKFQFWGLVPLSLQRWGWNLAWRRGHSGGDIQSPPLCQIKSPSVQHVAPAGQKTSKLASKVT